MKYKRMPIEVESPEQMGYENVKYNLAESSVSDTILKDIDFSVNDLKLCYGDHLGQPELRQLIVSSYKNLNENNVLVTAGAASALFIVSTTLLDKESHLIVLKPNYATNVETPRAIGCEIDFVDLKFENGFSFSVDDFKTKIKPNTKLISITHPHNPTGIVIDQQTVLQLAVLAEKNGCYLLVDETYRDLNMEGPYPLAASLHNRIISVSSVSKAYGLPGLRIGWLITQDKHLFEKFLAAKEQIFICNSVLDEEIAYQYLKKRDSYFSVIQKQVMEKYKMVLDWAATEERMELVKPGGGVVCFPRIKNGEQINTEKFYKILNTNYKTFVGPGHWFEMSDHYMRIGFGWPSEEELKQGLMHISKTLDDMKIK